MTGYHGGQTAKGGFYLERSTWELEQLYGDNLILPGSMEVRYLKVPAVAVVVAGPLTGLAFIIFLPLTGIIGIVGFLAYKVGQWVQIFGRKTLHLFTIGWKHTIAYLIRRSSVRGRKGTD